MSLMIVGLVLWTVAHLFKRVAPGVRQSMQDKMGDRSKGVIALLLLVALVLIVIGYRSAFGEVYWTRSAATVGINNLLMFVAVALFGLGSSRSRLRARIRHPMLTGVVVWAVAHLLVNGDTPSFVLFGWLAVWAITEMAIINRAEPGHVPFEEGSVAGDIRLAAISLVVFAVFAGIHTWLGYTPFGA